MTNVSTALVDKAQRFSKQDLEALANRFWVAKARAQKEGKAFAWNSFSVWLDDFLSLVPEDFDLQTHRIVYDQKLYPGYSKENMTFQESGKARLRKAGEVLEDNRRLQSLLRLDDSSRLLLAAEITLRLLSCESGTSLEKIVRDAATCLLYTSPSPRD